MPVKAFDFSLTFFDPCGILLCTLSGLICVNVEADLSPPWEYMQFVGNAVSMLINLLLYLSK